MTTRTAPYRQYTPPAGALSERARREVSAWLGILVLAFHVFAAAALPPRSPADGLAPFAQEILGDRIVICTPSGLVVLDHDGKPAPPDDESGHLELCVFCLPLMHGGLAAPAPMPVVLPPAAAGEAQPASPISTFGRPSLLSGAATPRAPPLPERPSPAASFSAGTS